MIFPLRLDSVSYVSIQILYGRENKEGDPEENL